MSPKSKIAYSLVAIILVGAFLYAGFLTRDQNTGTADGGTRTYQNEKYGFSFEYPTSFELTPPFPEPARDPLISDEEREEIFQKEQDEWRKELETYNESFTEGKESGPRTITISVRELSSLPTRAQAEQECEELWRTNQKLNPTITKEEACSPDMEFTREFLQEERRLVEESPIDTIIPRQHVAFPGGTVTEVNGIRGLRGSIPSGSAYEYQIHFGAFNQRGDFIAIGVYEFKEGAERQEDFSEANAALEMITSTFTFGK